VLTCFFYGILSQLLNDHEKATHSFPDFTIARRDFPFSKRFWRKRIRRGKNIIRTPASNWKVVQNLSKSHTGWAIPHG
jgi:hypothetical protein